MPANSGIRASTSAQSSSFAAFQSLRTASPARGVMRSATTAARTAFPSGRWRTARIVCDVRFCFRDLVHDDVRVGPFHGAFELRRLVSGSHEKTVVLLSHAFVDVDRNAHALSAPAVLTAFAQEVHGPIRRPRLRALAEVRDALVDLAKEGFIPSLSSQALVQLRGREPLGGTGSCAVRLDLAVFR